MNFSRQSIVLVPRIKLTQWEQIHKKQLYTNT